MSTDTRNRFDRVLFTMTMIGILLHKLKIKPTFLFNSLALHIKCGACCNRETFM